MLRGLLGCPLLLRCSAAKPLLSCCPLLTVQRAHVAATSVSCAVLRTCCACPPVPRLPLLPEALLTATVFTACRRRRGAGAAEWHGRQLHPPPPTLTHATSTPFPPQTAGRRWRC